MCEGQTGAESENFGVVAVRSANVLSEPGCENASSFVGQSTVEIGPREFDRIDAIDVDPGAVERSLLKLLREYFAGLRTFAARKPDERRFKHKSGQILRKSGADFSVPRGAHQILPSTHRTGKQKMEPRIRWFRARELIEDLRCFCVAAGGEMNARCLKRDGRLHATAAELFREKRRGFLRAIGEAKDAREFHACADERWPLRDRAAVAVLSALQIAAREQTAGNFKMRRCGSFD